MRRLSALLLVMLLTLPIAGCELVGDILEFGFWVIVVIIAVILLIGWLAKRAFSRRDRTPPPPRT